MTTPLQDHCDRWKLGCGNDICARRKTLVLGKGCVPADILFVGESPGESEDAIGKPFVGPAGQELDRWIKNALAYCEQAPRIAYTNLLACLPREADGRKAAEPLPEGVKQCSQRLQEFVLLCDGWNGSSLDDIEEGKEQLKLIVNVGSHARDYLDPRMWGSIKFHRPIPQVHILHPAYVLRQNTAQKLILAQRQTVILKSAMEEMY